LISSVSEEVISMPRYLSGPAVEISFGHGKLFIASLKQSTARFSFLFE